MNGSTLAKLLGDFVNNMCLDEREFVRVLNMKRPPRNRIIEDVLLPCVRTWADCYFTRNFDARNEGTCKIARDLNNSLRIRKLMTPPDDAFGFKQLCEEYSREQSQDHEFVAQAIIDFARNASEEDIYHLAYDLAYRTHRTLQQSVFRLLLAMARSWNTIPAKAVNEAVEKSQTPLWFI